jgi:hypothetical protein
MFEPDSIFVSGAFFVSFRRGFFVFKNYSVGVIFQSSKYKRVYEKVVAVA